MCRAEASIWPCLFGAWVLWTVLVWATMLPKNMEFQWGPVWFILWLEQLTLCHMAKKIKQFTPWAADTSMKFYWQVNSKFLEKGKSQLNMVPLHFFLAGEKFPNLRMHFQHKLTNIDVESAKMVFTQWENIFFFITTYFQFCAFSK